MAEENTTTQAAPAAPAAGAAGSDRAAAPSVDQSRQRIDFDAASFAYQDPSDPRNGKSQNQDTNPQAGKDTAAQAAAEAAAAQHAPDSFVNDKGEFDATKWLNFFSNGAPAKPAQAAALTSQAAPAQSPAAAATSPQPEKTPQQKYVDERKQYLAEIQKNIYAYRDIFNGLKAQGLNDQQAHFETARQLDGHIFQHMIERDNAFFLKSQEEDRQKYQEQLFSVQLKPQADANMALVASEYGGMQKLNKILTSPEAGRQVITLLYNISNPGKTFANNQEAAQAFDSWWVKIAQSPETIRQIITLSMSVWRDKSFPQVAAYIKKQTEAAATQRKAGASGVARTVTAPAEPQAENSMAQFMNPRRGPALQSQSRKT